MQIHQALIAPCGMNCALCVSYQAGQQDLNKQGFHKKYCLGCRPRGKHCLHMKDACDLVGKGQVQFCFECKDFPCQRLNSLDARYKARYHMSMIDNLRQIQSAGLEKFLAAQAEIWRCPTCDNLICCHNGLCLHCDLEKLRQKKTYTWDEPVTRKTEIR